MLIPKRLSPYVCCKPKTQLDVNNGTFNTDTLLLSFEQSDGGEPIVADLGELSKSYTENTDSVEFEGDGTKLYPLKAVTKSGRYFSVDDQDYELGNYDNDGADDAGVGAMALGPDSTVNTPNSIAVGNAASTDTVISDKSITGNVAIGANSTAKVSKVLEGGLEGYNASGVVIGNDAVTDGPGGGGVAIGEKAKNETFVGIAIGSNATVTGSEGNQDFGNGGLQGGGIAIGAYSRSAYDGSSRPSGTATPVAFGVASQATSDGATAFGESTQATARRSTAIGSEANASVDTAVALGGLSVANRSALSGVTASESPTVNGNQVYVPDIVDQSLKNAVVKTVRGSLGAVSVGKSNATRQIINVAAGTADTDAVNVAQLKAASRGFYLNRAGRAYLYTDERWVSQADDNYGTQYVNFSESAGGGAEPITEWENRGDIIYAGTHVHSVTVMGRINSATDISDMVIAAYFVYPDGADVLTTTGVSSDSGLIAIEMGRMMYVEGGSDDKPLTGPLSRLYRRKFTFDFTAPVDGELRLYYKPVNSDSRGGSTRYFVHASSWLLSH